MQMRFRVTLALLLAFVFIIGCGESRYVDKDLGIEVQRIDSDLEDRWSTNGVVVVSIDASSPAQGQLQEGELITHVVGAFDAQKDPNVTKALERALDEDRAAVLELTDGRRIQLGQRKRGEDLGLKFEGNRVSVAEEGKSGILAGLAMGDQVRLVIDEKRITSIKEYKKAIKEVRSYAERVTFHTNELSVIKLAAIQALGSLRSERALLPLVQVLRGKEPELRQPAAQALEELSETVSDPELVQVMTEHVTDPDAEIRRSSAAVLGRLKVETAIPVLVHALEDPIPGVRFKAGLALSQIGAPSLDALIEVLHQGSASAREIAATAMGDIGGDKARNELVKSMQNNPTLSFQLTVVDALGRIAKRNDAQALAALKQVAQNASDAGLQVFVEELLNKLHEHGS